MGLFAKLPLFLMRRAQGRRWASSSDVISITEMRHRMNKVCGVSEVYSEKQLERMELSGLLVEDQDQLAARNFDDSRISVAIPLSDPHFRDKYLNTGRVVRIGQLLEDLDSFAVLISYQHNSPSNSKEGRSPYSIVTAMVDELVLHVRDIDPQYDIVMRGHVSWQGRSSIEVSMTMEQLDRVVLETKFLMVARNNEGKAAVVHPLKLENEEERRLFEEGTARKKERMATGKQSLLSTPPTVDEMNLVHQIFLSTCKPETKSFKSRFLPPDAVFMKSTKLTNTLVCFPQHRNVHNKVFGGYIMRMAIELAWANAYTFSKCRPVPKAINDILFQAPVSIGSIMLMDSQVCVVEPPYFLVRVSAQVIDEKSSEPVTSNIFHFTFVSHQPLRKVIPYTYGESMVYLDGLRRLHKQIKRFND